jgi:hypothetical protein
MKKLIFLIVLTISVLVGVQAKATTTTTISTNGFNVVDTTPGFWNYYKFGQPRLAQFLQQILT